MKGLLHTYSYFLLVPEPWYTLNIKEIKAQGFDVYRWLPEFENAFKDMAKWIKEVEILKES